MLACISIIYAACSLAGLSGLLAAVVPLACISVRVNPVVLKVTFCLGKRVSVRVCVCASVCLCVCVCVCACVRTDLCGFLLAEVFEGKEMQVA